MQLQYQPVSARSVQKESSKPSVVLPGDAMTSEGVRSMVDEAEKDHKQTKIKVRFSRVVFMKLKIRPLFSLGSRSVKQDRRRPYPLSSV